MQQVTHRRWSWILTAAALLMLSVGAGAIALREITLDIDDLFRVNLDTQELFKVSLAGLRNTG